MFATERLTGGSKRLAIGLTALAIVLYAIADANFWRAYPASYVWTDLLISYEGGFVRRGLLGEIAYLLHPLVSAQAFLTGLFFVVYVGIAARIIHLACAHLNFGSLLFLVSPVALAFPLNDPGAFARKDAIIVAAFLLALFVIQRLSTRPLAAFGAIVLLYAVAGLVHELTWLYFPLAVAFLLNTSGRDLPRSGVVGIAAASVALVVIAAVISTIFKGDATLETRMVTAWQVRVPEAFVPLNAADYLSESFLTNISVMVGQTLDALVLAGYGMGAFLGGVAVVTYALDRPPGFSTDPLRMRLTRYGAYAMLLVFAIAADWGRVIHLFWMQAFVFLASLPPVQEVRPRLINTRPDPRMLLYGLALLFLYAATWRLAHSGLRTNALLPGYIFDLQPLYREILGHKPLVRIPIDQ